MAKALFNRMAEERGLRLRAESAGTEPSGKIHDNAVEAMRERGLELSEARPKMITNEMVERAQRVITLGCAVEATACPAVYLKEVEDWGLPDPAGKSIEEVRTIRDAVAQRVERLIASLDS